MPDYSQYSLQDFLNDDFFIRWVIEADPEQQAFWDSFLTQHPEKEELIRKASDIIRVYRKQDLFANEQGMEAVWQRIDATVQGQAARPIITWARFLRIAAVVTLITTFGVAFWLLSDRTQIMTTAYGEVKTITLPDHSVVTLNGNSTLSYQNNWGGNSPREVWIEGEGFFDVRHFNKDPSRIAPAERFIVHSKEVIIEVLGTSFNVKNRRSKTHISLISGKIKIQYADHSTSLSNANDLVLQPGDYVEYDSKKLIEKKKLPKPSQVTTWIRHEITFSDAYLKDITEKLQDEYGYSVNVNGEELMKMKIEGDITVANVDELLSTIATTLDLQIQQADKTITISRK